jgi:hypothetical protein
MDVTSIAPAGEMFPTVAGELRPSTLRTAENEVSTREWIRLSPTGGGKASEVLFAAEDARPRRNKDMIELLSTGAFPTYVSLTE